MTARTVNNLLAAALCDSGESEHRQFQTAIRHGRGPAAFGDRPLLKGMMLRCREQRVRAKSKHPRRSG
jgi:hypothetical protein